jgi:hypothetical protein
MTTKKPSQAEDEYIIKQDALARHKRAVEKARAMEAAAREEQKKLHFMKCPKCGMELEAVIFRGVTIDKCYSCNGTWLDAGELETLAGHGGDAVSRIVELFRGIPRAKPL